MKYIYKSIFICSALFLGSCNNLDEKLLSSPNKGFNIQVPKSFDGGGAGPNDEISNAFGQLREAGSANHGGYWSVQSVSSDEMAVTQKGGDWYDGGIWIDMHRHTFSSTNGPLNGTWTQQYAAINTCNEVLTTELDANQIAQVKALRAFFYYRLLDLYGRVKLVITP
ncbi:hypothetical protein [Polaribacter sp. HL-MS24]|uniref:hypothetical protein n=1 Tax=Polaribacter sp. HL-MS24 TaxID=3077735 RepID=UPI0029347BA2|nr:hypothetical protein [Polaribacter sp. HL-MS24]WOC40528.1 hypothetical protein RRF69_01630 [Polaribacter sp. HL-MS24]